MRGRSLFWGQGGDRARKAYRQPPTGRRLASVERKRCCFWGPICSSSRLHFWLACLVEPWELVRRLSRGRRTKPGALCLCFGGMAQGGAWQVFRACTAKQKCWWQTAHGLTGTRAPSPILFSRTGVMGALTKHSVFLLHPLPTPGQRQRRARSSLHLVIGRPCSTSHRGSQPKLYPVDEARPTPIKVASQRVAARKSPAQAAAERSP